MTLDSVVYTLPRVVFDVPQSLNKIAVAISVNFDISVPLDCTSFCGLLNVAL